MLAPLAERGVGDRGPRLEQPPRGALRRLAGGRQHEHVRQQAVIAFLESDLSRRHAQTFSSIPPITSMSLSCSIVSNAAATSILTKYNLGLASAYNCDGSSSHSAVVLDQLALQCLHRGEDLVRAKETRAHLGPVAVLLERQDLVQAAQRLVCALRASGTGGFLLGQLSFKPCKPTIRRPRLTIGRKPVGLGMRRTALAPCVLCRAARTCSSLSSSSSESASECRCGRECASHASWL